jgi:hypothetical protein
MGVSERGAARTRNQWLKRTIGKKAFSHPVYCCFRLIFWMTSGTSTLDEVGKVLSTVWRPVDLTHTEQCELSLFACTFQSFFPPLILIIYLWRYAPKRSCHMLYQVVRIIRNVWRKNINPYR